MTAVAPPPAAGPAAPPPGWVPAVDGPAAPPAGWVPADASAPAALQRPWASPPTGPTPQPDAEARTSPHLRLTGPAWVLLVLAVVSGVLWVATDAAPQLAMAVAVLAAVILDAVSARHAVAALGIEVDVPADAVAGHPTQWPLHLHGLRRPVALRPTLLPQPPQVLVEASAPGLLTLPGANRGVVHHFFVDAYASGPIGLFQAGRRYRVTPPRPVPLGPAPVAVDIDWPTPKAVGFGLSPVAPRGDDLFRSVRPYQRGDERRRIHWKSTAHHGQLMVRESDGVGVVALQVVVELGPPGLTAEMVAGVAVHVAGEALRKGWLVQLVTLDSASVPPPLLALGSPFGPPPVQPPPRWQALDTHAVRVRDVAAAREQLATAAFGTPQPPEWAGLVCKVNPEGVTWP